MQNSNIPGQDISGTYVCGYAPSAAGTFDTHFLIKKPLTSVFAVMVPGGAGGSSGWSDAAGSTTTPGGGGGGCGLGLFFMPGHLLPQHLMLQVGAAGTGGVASRAASAAGIAGTATALYSGRMVLSRTILLGMANSTPGSAATTSAGGGSGGAGSGSASYFPIQVKTVGLGAVGGTTAAGATWTRRSFVNGGGGGSGITTTNIAVNGSADTVTYGQFPTRTGQPTTTTTDTTLGYGCLAQSNLIPGFAGGRGGCSSTGTGGDGAPGDLGCGGGGGGGSNSAASAGGSGGPGGPGFAILVEV